MLQTIICLKQLKPIILLLPGIGAARFRRPTFVSTADPNTLDGSLNEVFTGDYHTQRKQNINIYGTFITIKHGFGAHQSVSV